MTVRDAGRRRDGYLPISEYGAIGNGRTVALVGSDGSIDWLCLPRIDSPSVFGRLLDYRRGGFWQIQPDCDWTSTRHYIEDTNVLVTRFETAQGIAEIVDLMPSIGFGANLGVVDRLTSGMVVRIVRGVEGEVPMRQEILPAFDYARDIARYELVPGRGALARGRREYLALASPTDLQPDRNGGLSSTFKMCPGDELHNIAAYHGSPGAIWMDIAPGTADRLFGYELFGWRTWISRCTYEGPYSEYVRRGALTLKLLDYLPTGAMAAAATTSLPEDIGGVRNWDYRYTWIRDTTYAIFSFLSIGYREEAESFFQWVIDATDLRASSLQIMYGVGGETELREEELGHLSGYRNSRPVRVGNGAHQQRQFDVWGELLDGAYTYRRFGGVISETLWDYLASIVDHMLLHWRDADSGIWEVRSAPQRMTYSNVMTWVGLDRAIRLAKLDGRRAPIETWRRVRDEVRRDVYRHGVSKETGTFVQSFGGSALDASTLSFPLRHFVDAREDVMSATIDAVERELTSNGLVARYLVNSDGTNLDGLPGDEGHFVLTSCWLIECLIARDEIDRARELLELLLSRQNDLGLYSEQIDPKTGEHLGNFPQAFSHLGVINTILNFARATGEIEPVPDLEGNGPPTGVLND